ncbi:hypothetical protein ACWC24_39865 [Streptomyces sp. NPDC001443]
MTKSHGRKSRARNKSRTRGAAYAAANAGTLHHHGGGPSNEDLRPADPSRWGVETAPDMRTASALIGARIEQCAPCLESLTAKLFNEEPIVLAVTAASVYSLHPAHERPTGEGVADRSAQAFFLLVQHVRAIAGDARILLASVERMPRADRAALLDDALDLWALYGLDHPSLLRGQDVDTARSPDLTITAPSSEPNNDGPGTVTAFPALVHPAAEGRPAEGAGAAARSAVASRSAQRPVPHAVRTRQHRSSAIAPSKENRVHMSETTMNIEQHAEDASRSLVDLVRALHNDGIDYPLEAYRVLSYLTRVAGEMRTALDLLDTSVQSLQNKGRLMSDSRGEPLDEVIARFTQSSGRARDLAGDLNATLAKAYSAVGHLAYKEAPEEQEPAAHS